MMRLRMIALAMALVVASTASAQIAYMGGTTYFQDFDALASNPAGNPYAWIDNVTIPGWVSNQTAYLAGNGSSAVGGLYSFGINNAGDRALGSIGDGGPVEYGVVLTNVHAVWTLTSFTVSYDVEQWRDAANIPQLVELDYSLDGGLTWTPLPLGDLVSIHNASAGALNGNAVANKYLVNATVNGINWAPGTNLILRWRDFDNPGVADHGLAIDNFAFSAVPEPTTFALVGLGMGAAGFVTRRLRRKKAEVVA